MKTSFILFAIAGLGALLAVNFWLDQGGSFGGGSQIEKLSTAVVAPEKIQQAEQSVFLVYRPDGARATAFLVDSKCGVFATNAHVAVFVEESLQSNFPVSLKQANSGKTIEISATKAHPARALLKRLVDEYGPMTRSNAGLFQGLPVLEAYDAALLYGKDESCDADGKIDDIPQLKIASAQSLSSLKGGDPIALIGFHGHGTTTTDIEWLTVSPRIEVGHVRAIGSYIPIPAGKTVTNQRVKQAVLHTLSTTHGTSGSPMINSDGEVIAVNQGAAAVGSEEGVRVLERIGHRADIVTELMTGTEAQLRADYTEAIEEMLKQHSSAQETLVALAEQVAETLTTRPGSRENVKLTSFDGGKAQFGPVQRVFTVLGADGVPYSFAQPGRYFHGRADLAPGKAYVLRALDYDMEVKLSDELKAQYRQELGVDLYDFLCPIAIGTRIGGVGSFTWNSEASQIASFPIDRRTASAPVPLEYIIWRHPACSGESLSFDIALAGYDVTPKPANPALAFWEDVTGRIKHGLSTLKKLLRWEAERTA